MSKEYYKRIITDTSNREGYTPPVPEPENCKNHCPYGYGRSFCFPCMAKIMAEHRAAAQKE